MKYFYITNLQGDVVGIANSNGIGGSYEYDAWGRIIAMDSASSIEYSALTYNPLRYRGYIYDNETGFYYLQTRYYDPEIGRFINADGDVSTGGVGAGLAGTTFMGATATQAFAWGLLQLILLHGSLLRYMAYQWRVWSMKEWILRYLLL